MAGYFTAKLFDLEFEMEPTRIAERVNEAGGWRSPLANGVVGRASSRRIQLRFVTGLLFRSFKPVLSGNITETPAGSRLNLRYGAQAWVYGFYLLAYLFLTVVTGGLMSKGFTAGTPAVDKLSAVGILTCLFVAPVCIRKLVTRDSEAELAYMLEFLTQDASARL